MASRFSLVFVLVVLAVAGGSSAADSTPSSSPPPSANKTPPSTGNGNSTANNNPVEGLGPSQDYPDYEIPTDLAPDGVVLVEDSMPVTPPGEDEGHVEEDSKSGKPATSPGASGSTSVAVGSTSAVAAAAAVASGLFLF